MPIYPQPWERFSNEQQATSFSRTEAARCCGWSRMLATGLLACVVDAGVCCVRLQHRILTPSVRTAPSSERQLTVMGAHTAYTGISKMS